jgi:hypothetical protein
MIGVNPPGHYMWDPRTTDEQIDRYAALCARDATCSARTADLAASMRKTAADLPDRWLFLPIKASNVRIMSFFGLMESTSASAPASAPTILDGWLAAATGDASGLWFASVFGDLLFPRMFVRGQYAAAGSVDAQAARDYFAANGPGHGSNLGYAATAFTWGGGELADAWPAAAEVGAYRQVRPSAVETLLIGGEVDFSTPPQTAAAELLPYLSNGHQVVLPGLGHTASFFAEQPAAGSRLVNTFFASGQVDDSLYTPQRVDFTPRYTPTLLAKLLLGTMVAVAGVALLSLLWMSVRLGRRGAFGIKVSAALRSVYPGVLGLGGWFFGVLVVLVVSPAVPVDDARLAVFAIGLPIGAGIALAWLNPTDRRTRQATGVVLAGSGALVGAWLGFHAVEGLLAVLTTIVAAAAAANLALVSLDAFSTRAARSTNEGPPPLPAAVVTVS